MQEYNNIIESLHTKYQNNEYMSNRLHYHLTTVLTASLETECNNHGKRLERNNQLISDQIGPIAKLEKIQFVSGLPKTRSGKIMRRILRKIAEGDFSNFGDTSTLLNPEIVDEIKKGKI
jgi:acyl-CoA synthetase (AMP-forming)/AMP-acid ligase II